MSYALKPTHVRGVARYLARKYHARVTTKADKAEMELIEAFLELCHIAAADRFMDGYATTLPPPILVTKPTVYLPFTPGSTAKTAPHLETQLEVLGHEFTHVVQAAHDPLGFPTLYVAKRTYRAQKEAKALEVNLELHRFLTDDMLNPVQLAYGLRAYGLRWADVNVVAKHLRSASVTIGYGGVSNEVSKQIIRWLKRH